MTPSELEAIRARDANSCPQPPIVDESYLQPAQRDRHKLLDYVNELRAAAGKVTCETCHGTGIERTLVTACPDCADIRRLLGKP